MAQGPLIVSVPADMLKKKPPHGAQCNNCGLCCWSSKCDISRALFGAAETERPACPALRFDSEQKSFCNVIANPEQYTDRDPDEARAAAKLLMYAGKGCTMRINGEMNLRFQAELEIYDLRNREALDRAAALWGIKQPEMPF